jgi:hypothetical protein
MAQKFLPNNRKLLDYEGKDRIVFFALYGRAMPRTMLSLEEGTYVLGFYMVKKRGEDECNRLLVSLWEVNPIGKR